MVWPMNLQKLAQTGKWRKDNADCTKCFTLFYKLLGSPRWSIEDCLVLKIKICVHGTHQGVYPVSMIPVIFFFFFFWKNYYSGASNKHYNFCDYYFLPLIISVTLHTDLWKLAPYFKKRKKRVCYSIVCYKRTIDCGMQFKDDICQQMPCIIWHCRNSNLFLFSK